MFYIVRFHIKAGMVHIHWLKNGLIHVLIERFARDYLNQVSQNVVGKTVFPPASWLIFQRGFYNSLNKLFQCHAIAIADVTDIEFPNYIGATITKTGRMAKQITDGNIPFQRNCPHRIDSGISGSNYPQVGKFRDVFFYRFIEQEFPFIV